MKLKFCGAAETTTGSQHLLEINGQRILMDCGLYQGRRKDSYERNLNFLFNPAEVDVVVLSHAHIDHSGNLPNLVKQGFTGNIYGTFATRDLCQIMLADSARIQQNDVEYINRKRARDGEEPVEPLYSEHDAAQVMTQFVNTGYDRAIPIADGVKLSFVDAGHILGSAQVVLDLHEQDSGRKARLLFSGDVGRGSNILLRDPVPVDNVDFMIMESTYGAREHDLPTRADERLTGILAEAIEKKGKVIIPAFAVERTQQLLYVLHELVQDGKIPEVPIFVDSPLAVNATEIFRLHPECFNQEVYDFLMENRGFLAFENLTLIRSAAKSKELNDLAGASIIISASGMAEFGRIRHHLKNNIGTSRNTILFVGYCAENTLGAKILNGDKEVNIFGKPHKVKAKIESIDSFSGHADHSELLDYFDATGGPKKKVWIVHGSTTQSEPLCEELAGKHPDGEISVARLGEEVEF